MKELLKNINDAFKGVELGCGLSLNMTEFNDSWGSDSQYLKLANFDEKHKWDTISDKTLEKFTVVFCFTDAYGFRFYIPAYMRWTINNVDSDSIIGDMPIYAIDPIKFEMLHSISMASFMTADQLTVMIDFLKWCCDDNKEKCDSRVASENLAKMKKMIC